MSFDKTILAQGCVLEGDIGLYRPNDNVAGVRANKLIKQKGYKNVWILEDDFTFEVSKETFEKGYPNIEKFRNLRKEYGMDKKFHSLQSKRLGI